MRHYEWLYPPRTSLEEIIFNVLNALEAFLCLNRPSFRLCRLDDISTWKGEALDWSHTVASKLQRMPLLDYILLLTPSIDVTFKFTQTQLLLVAVWPVVQSSTSNRFQPDQWYFSIYKQLGLSFGTPKAELSIFSKGGALTLSFLGTNAFLRCSQNC